MAKEKKEPTPAELKEAEERKRELQEQKEKISALWIYHKSSSKEDVVLTL